MKEGIVVPDACSPQQKLYESRFPMTQSLWRTTFQPNLFLTTYLMQLCVPPTPSSLEKLERIEWPLQNYLKAIVVFGCCCCRRHFRDSYFVRFFLFRKWVCGIQSFFVEIRVYTSSTYITYVWVPSSRTTPTFSYCWGLSSHPYRAALFQHVVQYLFLRTSSVAHDRTLVVQYQAEKDFEEILNWYIRVQREGRTGLDAAAKLSLDQSSTSDTIREERGLEYL